MKPDLLTSVRLRFVRPKPVENVGAVMTVGNRNFDVRLHLKHLPQLGRETTEKVGITFLDPEHASPIVLPGVRFTLRDWRVFADGQVLETYYESGKRDRT